MIFCSYGIVHEVLSFINVGRMLKSVSLFLTAHSQMIPTFQLFFCKISIAFLSRKTLPSNLCSQKLRLLFGTLANLQLLCLCQKHPCTKIQVFHFLKTMSGLIPKTLQSKRYLKPKAKRVFLIKISGFVFLDFIPDIILVLFSFDTISNETPET